MANYLEGVDPTRDDTPIRIGEDADGLSYNEKTNRWEIEDDKSNFDNLDNEANISNDFSGLHQVTPGFLGGDPGSKPEALHTEYAQGESSGKAYTTEDIVFYLRKAGS